MRVAIYRPEIEANHYEVDKKRAFNSYRVESH
jgi:hypothetical protein